MKEQDENKTTNERQDISLIKSPAPFVKGQKGGPGRHKTLVHQAPKTPEEVRALLFQVIDAETANKMIYSLRKKIARGNITTLEWIFDRLIGRPAVQVHVDASGALTQFISAWQTLLTEPRDEVTEAISAHSQVIEGEFSPATSLDEMDESDEDANEDDDADEDED